MTSLSCRVQNICIQPITKPGDNPASLGWGWPALYSTVEQKSSSEGAAEPSLPPRNSTELPEMWERAACMMDEVLVRGDGTWRQCEKSKGTSLWLLSFKMILTYCLAKSWIFAL